MSRSFRMQRSKTQTGHPCDILTLRSKCLSQAPPRDPLSRQSKFINPYSKDKPSKKSILKFQEPHSIALLPKRHQKVASECRMEPHAGVPEGDGERYRIEGVVGRGGGASTVFQGFCEVSDRRVAVKRVLAQGRGGINREGELLTRLDHPNVVKLLDQYETIERGRKFQCIVMPYYECNLGQLLREKWVGEGEAKKYAMQILAGLEYLHQESIVHRDLKPCNIFIDNRLKKAIIGDFCSARRICFGQSISGQPCPISYRAPQLLFGPNNYSPSSDMWAFACLLLDLTTRQPFFKASSNTELLLQIITRLGTPSMQEVCEMDPSYNPRQYEKLPRVKAKREGIFSSQAALNDLLKKILVYSPERRITASEALQHEYFREVGKGDYLRTEASETTPKHKRDSSNLQTVASLQDSTSSKARQKPSQTILKAYLGKMKALHPLARRIAF